MRENGREIQCRKSYPISVCGIALDVLARPVQMVDMHENDHPGHPCTSIVLVVRMILFYYQTVLRTL